MSGFTGGTLLARVFGSDVAARFGLSLPKLTNIMRGRFRSISVKELEDGVARLGVDGKIVARTRTRSQN